MKKQSEVLIKLFGDNDKISSLFESSWKDKEKTSEYYSDFAAVISQLLANVYKVYNYKELLSEPDLIELKRYHNFLLKAANVCNAKVLPEEQASLFFDANPKRGDRVLINTGNSSTPKIYLGTITLVGINKAVSYRLDNGSQGRSRISNSATGFVGFSRSKQHRVKEICLDELCSYLDRERWVPSFYEEYIKKPVDKIEDKKFNVIVPLCTDKLSPGDVLGSNNYARHGLSFYSKPDKSQIKQLYAKIAELTGMIILAADKTKDCMCIGDDHKMVYLDPVTHRHWILSCKDTPNCDITCALADIDAVINFLKRGA